ncbi:cell division protein FtsL [Vagococcus sp. DIV0080]|uniref:Cell division protein FtsL n=1 Tax=Candidatus Vagococcus giribetii TaxID=2230876 RepID=A0ABS3HQD7_9ENTE|nr:cell division protein FtsL [Vagococcus sp. DIV0080]MBO0475951.1 cell division protein FtsL [Vagococcus sp. DIV0080]
MALPERKNLELYDAPHATPSSQDERLRETVPYLVPQSKLKKVSKLEKIVFCAFVATFLFLSIATIKMTTSINREEEAITSVQQDINTSKSAIDKLEQEKNELLRSDRIKGIAEKANIELREDNIRKIK